MRLILPIAMIAVWLSAMVAVKMIVAPWIVHSFGFMGAAITVGAIFATAKWLED